MLGVGLSVPQVAGSSGLPNLVTNGTFDTGITGWSNSSGGTVSWNSGLQALNVTTVTTNGRVRTTVSGLVVGRTYAVTGRLVSRVNGSWQMYAGPASNYGGRLGNSTANADNHSFSFTATATSHDIVLIDVSGTSGPTSVWDDIAVR